jgi:hypothetical protein
MSLSDDLLGDIEAFDQAEGTKKVKHPSGYEPGIDTERGTYTVSSESPMTPAAVSGRFAQQMKDASLDPDEWYLEDDRIEMRTWDMNLGEGKVHVAYYFKARIRRLKDDDAPDYDELIADIRSWEPVRHGEPQEGDPRTFVVVLSDWQLGKRDGDGTKGIVARILAGIDESHARLQALLSEGRNIERLIIVGLGDLVEGCDGFYPMQTFTVELDRRAQMRVARRLLSHAVRLFAPLVPHVTVVGVGGNHGENRKNGKAFTTFADNDDVAVFEQVAEAFAENPSSFGHVTFLVPNDELSVTVRAGDHVLGFTHGHLGSRAGNAGLSHTKVWNWWKGQAHGRSAVGDADVLLNGHFHYFNWCINGSRHHIQVPALDHSTWFEQSSGSSTQHGMVSFLVGELPVEELIIHPCSVIG